MLLFAFPNSLNISHRFRYDREKKKQTTLKLLLYIAVLYLLQTASVKGTGKKEKKKRKREKKGKGKGKKDTGEISVHHFLSTEYYVSDAVLRNNGIKCLSEMKKVGDKEHIRGIYNCLLRNVVRLPQLPC